MPFVCGTPGSKWRSNLLYEKTGNYQSMNEVRFTGPVIVKSWYWKWTTGLPGSGRQCWRAMFWLINMAQITFPFHFPLRIYQ